MGATAMSRDWPQVTPALSARPALLAQVLQLTLQRVGGSNHSQGKTLDCKGQEALSRSTPTNALRATFADLCEGLLPHSKPPYKAQAHTTWQEPGTTHSATGNWRTARANHLAKELPTFANALPPEETMCNNNKPIAQSAA